MNLCFSNIAWGKDENKKIINLFNQEKISYLEYAPDLIIKNYKKKGIFLKLKNFGKKKDQIIFNAICPLRN